jgi:signal transduction histidine kinase
MVNRQGQILRRWSLRASRLDEREPSRPTLRPGHGEVTEEWQIGDQRQRMVTLRQPAAPGSDVIQEIGIPQEQIDQEVAALERKLQMKLWIGAGVAVLILLIAFAYVLRLLSRARMLEAQAQMDDRLTFVGALAAGLAHEIRNPLNVLSMNLQMLEEEISARGDGGESLVYTAALQGEIRRLSSLVNNFLSYARPNQPRFESRDLNQLLQDLCAFVRPEFERRELTLRQELALYLPPVDLDEAQIRQAILNILMNATHILKPAGTVTVRSRVGPDGGAVVSIADDGPGIQEEDREKIFEVFYSSRGGGTGLGLPIAARIVEAHGGTISVVAVSLKKACFILKLPRRHPRTTAVESAEHLLNSSERA